jgi:hypothetical protein
VPFFMRSGAQVAGGARWPSRPHDVNSATERPMAPSFFRLFQFIYERQSLKLRDFHWCVKRDAPNLFGNVRREVGDAWHAHLLFTFGRISDGFFT